MLEEAGFRESHVYWELEDENGEDSGGGAAATTTPVTPVGWPTSWRSSRSMGTTRLEWSDQSDLRGAVAGMRNSVVANPARGFN